MSGWGAGIQDFDNDGYKDLFSANSHVSENADIDPQQHYLQANAVFRNLHMAHLHDVSAQAGAAMQLRAAHRGMRLRRSQQRWQDRCSGLGDWQPGRIALQHLDGQ